MLQPVAPNSRMGHHHHEYLREEFRSKGLALSGRYSGKAAYRPTLGLEIEYSVVLAGTTQLADQETRDRIIALNAGLFKEELGASQLELNSRPCDLLDEGFEKLENHLKECEAEAARAGASCGAEIIRIGSFPLCPLAAVTLTRGDRYSQYQQWVDKLHCAGTVTALGRFERTSPATANVMSLMNSVQFNLAARSTAEAVRLLNLSFALTPQLVAVAGNARFLDGKDTGYADIRMLMWERTHDTRSVSEALSGAPLNVGAPARYFDSFEDYLEEVCRFLGRSADLPFIKADQDRTFEIGMGLCWLDSKLKFRAESVLIEFRPVSAQPTVAEDVAMAAYYVGLLEYYRNREFKFPRAELNKLNRYAAMRDGFDATFLVESSCHTFQMIPARAAVAVSLENAAAGLREAGFDDGVNKLAILTDRLRQGLTPSDKLAQSIRELRGERCSPRQALERAVRNCVVVSP